MLGGGYSSSMFQAWGGRIRESTAVVVAHPWLEQHGARDLVLQNGMFAKMGAKCYRRKDITQREHTNGDNLLIYPIRTKKRIDDSDPADYVPVQSAREGCAYWVARGHILTDGEETEVVQNLKDMWCSGEGVSSYMVGFYHWLTQPPSSAPYEAYDDYERELPPGLILPYALCQCGYAPSWNGELGQRCPRCNLNQKRHR